MDKSRILVVEDEAITAKAIRTMLINMGYDVTAVAHTGESAIQKAAETSPDLILMDINLRGKMDGIQAAECILAQSDIPVIYLTAYSDPETLGRAKITSPLGYIVKPFEERSLNVTVEMSLYRYSMEKKLQESEQKYRFITENIEDLIAVLNAEGRYTYVNQTHERALGYQVTELMGMEIMEFLHPDDRGDAIKALAVTTGKREPVEFRYMCKNGAYKWIEWRNQVLSTSNDKELQILMAGSDTSMRKQAEQTIARKTEELLSAEEELQFLNQNLEQKIAEKTSEYSSLVKQKDDFIAQLSHDLKNPLTPLVCLSPMLRDKQSDPDSRDLMDIIVNNIDFMKDLVDKTIEVARLNSTDIKLDLTEIDLSDQLNSLIRNKLPYFAQHNVTTENRIDEGITIKWDRILLTEVFDNLSSNAIKFMPDGGALIFEAQANETEIVVSVKDNGIGLKEGQAELMFDNLYRDDDSNHQLGSSGMGLTICKRAVEKHEGRIWAQSDGPGTGTAICFTIPVKAEAAI